MKKKILLAAVILLILINIASVFGVLNVSFDRSESDGELTVTGSVYSSVYDEPANQTVSFAVYGDGSLLTPNSGSSTVLGSVYDSVYGNVYYYDYTDLVFDLEIGTVSYDVYAVVNGSIVDTYSFTETRTPTPTPEVTPSPTPTPTSAPTPTSTPVPAATATPTPTPVVSPTPVEDEDDKTVTLTIIPEASEGEKVEVEITEDVMDILLDIAETNSDGQKSIKAVIEEIEGKEEYDVSLPKSIITKDTDDIVIEIETPVASVKMPSNMIDDEDTGTGESINLAIAKVDKETLSTEAKAKVGDRPIIKVELKKGDESINWSNPDAPITISVPYTPTAEELENPELIVIYYIDSSGELQTVPTGKYNPATGKVTFQTTHLSEYAIGYNYKTFADIGDIAWAQSNIEVLASRGIIKGVDDDTFLPSANISRADFAILLVRALGLNADFTVNFTGINETDYFYNETGIAKELGIIKGYSDGTFKPRDYITRQDMIVMADRAMTVANRSVNSGSLFDIANYLDSDLVADYALNAVTNFVENGLIIGNNQKLKPLDNTTRAEAAVLIYRLYNYQ